VGWVHGLSQDEERGGVVTRGRDEATQ